MWKDLRFALRGLGGQPTYTVVVVLTLTLGIGGSTAIFSVVNAVLLRDLPYPDYERIYVMQSVAPDGSRAGIRPIEYSPIYEVENHPTVEAAAIAWSQESQVVGGDQRAYPTVRYGVSDQFFEVFGPQMQLGRGFERGENPGPIVISYALWRDAFGSDPDIVGQLVDAEGIPRPVVGVTPPDFDFPESPGFWYLMRLGRNFDAIRGYRGFMKLRAGRSEAQIEADLARISTDVGPDPATNQPVSFVAEPFIEYVVGDLATTVTILLAATGVLLLIACINVTNLMLTRATARGREVALREALGAGRWRIIRQLLTESLALSLIGGALGLALAAAGIRLMLGIVPTDLPRMDEVPLDNTVMAFAIGITLATGLVIALAPAWRLTRSPLSALVNEGGRGNPGGRERHRLFSTLVVTEVALAVLLVTGAGLLVRSYLNLARTDPGFDPERIVTLSMNVPGRSEISFVPPSGPGELPTITGSYAPMAAFFRQLLERIVTIAGVESAATTLSLPLNSIQYGGNSVFNVVGDPGQQSDRGARLARTRSVSLDFFDTMGIRLLSGRGFLSSDRMDGPGVAVVNETFVNRYFPGQDPVGRRLRYPENLWVPGQPGFQGGHRTVDEVQIVGVVGDVRYQGLGFPPEPSIYLSSEQWINRRLTVIARASIEDPGSLIPAIRRELEAMDPLVTAQFGTYEAIVGASTARERLAMTLLVVFGGMALLLAAVGIYGLMSYAVAQRRGEIAVRTAMGATASQIMRLILSRGFLLTVVGIALGLVGSIALRRLVESQLYGVSPLDLSVFLLVPAILFAVSALACFLPAQRATRIQPAEVLKAE